MTSATHARRILALLATTPGLDDDMIARALSIAPRQTVNRICRRLAAQGALARERGDSGKIVNRLIDGAAVAAVPGGARRAAPAQRRIEVSRPAFEADRSLCPADLAKTVILIPCSKSKNQSAAAAGRAAFTDSLPDALAGELVHARHQVAGRVGLDETTLMPALERYSGSLYQNGGREALRDLLAERAHVIIISGGYGAVLATEPIGMYKAALRPSWWPDRLLARVLVAYAMRHNLRTVRAFAAATSPYARVLARVPWSEANIDDALLIMPEARAGGMRMSPASIGQALAALRDRTLTSGWKSSYDLRLEILSPAVPGTGRASSAMPGGRGR